MPPQLQQQDQLQQWEERLQALKDKKALERPLPTRLQAVAKKLRKAEQNRDELEKHLVDIKKKYDEDLQTSTQTLEQLKVDIKKLQEEEDATGDEVKAGASAPSEDQPFHEVFAKIVVPPALQQAWQNAQNQMGTILQQTQQALVQQQREQQRQAEAAAQEAARVTGMEVEGDELDRLALQIKGPKPEEIDQCVWDRQLQQTKQQLQAMRNQSAPPPAPEPSVKGKGKDKRGPDAASASAAAAAEVKEKAEAAKAADERRRLRSRSPPEGDESAR